MKKIITTCFYFIFLLAIHNAQAQTYFISPVAGTGTYGFSGDGGLAVNAELNGPAGIAVDDSGNIYFCDQSNNRIRKITPAGIITTVAGNGTYGYSGDNGPATAAEMSNPIGLALDDSDNIFIADWGNSRIRKVNTKGIIKTIAGSAVSGFSGDNGPATKAQLSQPFGVAVDSLGNIYIDDTNNERVRKVNANGIITTIAGNGVRNNDTGDGGLATNAAINWPTWVWADHKGNIYIANANLLRKVNVNDTITTVVGNGTGGHSGDEGLATNASIGFMEGGGAFDDSGNFYFPEFYYEYVRKVYANDTINTIAGNGTQGFAVPYGNADAAELSFPYATAADRFGNIYVTDNGNQRIRKLSPCSKTVTINTVSPTICSGDSVTLSISGANTYAWSPADGLSSSIGASVNASPSVTTTYTITGTTCSATATITVTVKPGPDITINPSPAIYCAGQNVTLTASGAPYYQWSPSVGLSSTTGSVVVANPTTETTYTVTSTAAGCTAQATVVVSIESIPNKPVISVDGTTLISSATQGNQWFLNDTIIPGATNQTYIALKSGYYSVTAENPVNGCSSTSDSVKVSLTGIDQLSVNNNQLSIYPNPSSNQLTISSRSAMDNIEMANVLGQIVFNANQISTTKSLSGYLGAGGTGLKQTLNISTLPDGIYFITITSGNETTTQKVSVIHSNK